MSEEHMQRAEESMRRIEIMLRRDHLVREAAELQKEQRWPVRGVRGVLRLVDDEQPSKPG